MKRFITDLYQPFFKMVATDQYSVNAKSQKDKDTIQDLISRGVLSNVQEQTMDYRTFPVYEQPLNKLLQILHHYECDKMYMGEIEFMDMMHDCGDPYMHYSSRKTLKMFGCEIVTLPYMQGILPVKEKK